MTAAVIDRLAIDWLAVDWGSSRLRLWALDGAGRVLHRAESDEGAAGLAPDGFEPVLLRHLGPWLPAEPPRPLPVIVCGMAGSRQGWREAAYRAVPCPPLGAPLTRVAARDPRLAVHLLPGLSQADPADVMRGEETQIAGCLAARPGFAGTLCLPGTHTKWVAVADGQVAGFATFLTGELFALLTRQSVLRHSVGAEDAWDAAAFADAVAEAVAAPAALTRGLFPLRAAGLLHALPEAAARARLSGLLIGAEIAAAAPFWRDRPVTVIAATALADLYRQALAAQGVAVETMDATDATLAGLAQARATLLEVP